jgi:hypothetical protein
MKNQTELTAGTKVGEDTAAEMFREGGLNTSALKQQAQERNKRGTKRWQDE